MLPGELHQAGTDEVADAFRVAHHARDQDAGLRLVEVAHRQVRDVLVDGAPHLGDGRLRRDAEELRQRVRRHRLHQRRGAGDERDRHQQLGPALGEDVVDQVLRRGRQHEAAQPVDQHHAPGRARDGRGAPTRGRSLPATLRTSGSSSCRPCRPSRRSPRRAASVSPTIARRPASRVSPSYSDRAWPRPAVWHCFPV